MSSDEAKVHDYSLCTLNRLGWKRNCTVKTIKHHSFLSGHCRQRIYFKDNYLSPVFVRILLKPSDIVLKEETSILQTTKLHQQCKRKTVTCGSLICQLFSSAEALVE